MKITIIAVGKLKEKYLREGINEYAKRLSGFCRLQIIEVPDVKAPENLSRAQEEMVLAKEGDNILKRIKGNSMLICLDVSGKRFNSEALASMVREKMLMGESDYTFIIGGSLGIDKKVLGMADLKLSLSDMTFPHQLARLILLEQVFRIFKIINGEPYHK